MVMQSLKNHHILFFKFESFHVIARAVHFCPTLPGTARQGKCAPHCIPWHRPPHQLRIRGAMPKGQVCCSAGEQSPRSGGDCFG